MTDQARAADRGRSKDSGATNQRPEWTAPCEKALPVPSPPNDQNRAAERISSDYIDRTIATVRIHRDADNCWPQWANIFADEIERLREEMDRAALWLESRQDPPRYAAEILRKALG